MEFLKNNFITIIVIVFLTYSCNNQQKKSDNVFKPADVEKISEKHMDSISLEFINYKVSNIGDMVKYLDEFPAIWKSYLGEDGYKRFKQTMATLNDPIYVKKINTIFDESPEKYEALYKMMKDNIPKETHKIFDEMLPAAMSSKNLDDVVGEASSVVDIKKDVDETIYTIDNNGNVVNSKFVDEEGNLIERDIKTNTQGDVNDELNKVDSLKNKNSLM